LPNSVPGWPAAVQGRPEKTGEEAPEAEGAPAASPVEAGVLLTAAEPCSLKNSRMECNDIGLVTRARTGDTDAFRVLVERHSRPLFRLAYRMTGNQQDAEDVVQESFLRAHKQLARFDERASFGTWLYRIAVNCSLDLVRARKRRNELVAPADPEMDDPLLALPSHDPAPDRIAMSGEVRDRVAEAMTELSAAERTAFVLRHFEGMCIDDVSRVLGCQPGAAKHSVFRAVQKLRRALEPLVSAAR
jgi:RNA polymerase sigma-70 factor (ECF subfamily)